VLKILPELSILKLGCNYKHWQELTQKLSVSDMPKELQGIYRCLNQYHEDNNSAQDLSVSDLSNLYFASNPRDRDFAIKVFEQLQSSDDPSSHTVGKLCKSIVHSRLLREISLDAYDVAEGRGDIAKLLGKFGELQGTSDDEGTNDDDPEFVNTNLEELVHEAVKKPGLRWRLQTLNHMFGSLRKGDFGFVFARPETGKTTFLASEVTYMAEQLGDEDGPILWINNEEQGSKVMLRNAQASLGITLTNLFRDVKKANANFKERTRGKLLMVDDAGITKKKVEGLCVKYKPRLIVLDQIDKIKGFENDREDLRLGAIYQWARELAKLYGSVIAVCQADGTGENQKWLTMAHVANAKTAKQAEADFILGIGKINEPGYDMIRYLHASKNKLMGDEDSDPSMRHGRMEVLIEPDVARYKDLM
jgi:replicative DNA helicase